MTFSIFVSSLVLAGVYLLVSLGWIIVYRATKVLNFAVGEYILLGAVVYGTMYDAWHVPAPLALLLSALVTAFIAALTYDTVMRPLSGRPVFSQVIVTFGVGIVMTSVIAMIWGNQDTALVPAVKNKVFHLPDGAILTSLDLVIMALAVGVFLALLAYLRWSRSGRQMRAAAELPLLASQSGININRVFRQAWAISGFALGIAGVGYAYLTLVSPSLSDLGLVGIVPALIGGLDSVKGAIVGSIAIAAIESYAGIYLGSGLGSVAPYFVILIVLIIRPYGLFGVREVRRV